MNIHEISMRRAFNSNSSLFLSALILENRMKWSKSLPALKGVFNKNPIKAGKDFDHFIRFSNIIRKPDEVIKILTGIEGDFQ